MVELYRQVLYPERHLIRQRKSHLELVAHSSSAGRLRRSRSEPKGHWRLLEHMHNSSQVSTQFCGSYPHPTVLICKQATDRFGHRSRHSTSFRTLMCSVMCISRACSGSDDAMAQKLHFGSSHVSSSKAYLCDHALIGEAVSLQRYWANR